MPAEGLHRWAYYDPPGILTVCYGSTTNVQLHHHYSLDECKQRINHDMLAAITKVDECVPGLPVNVLVAFGDAAYNLGPKIACDVHASGAARYLKAGNILEACKQLLRWNKAKVGGVQVPLPGLTTRRQHEYEICINPNQDTI